MRRIGLLLTIIAIAPTAHAQPDMVDLRVTVSAAPSTATAPASVTASFNSAPLDAGLDDAYGPYPESAAPASVPSVGQVIAAIEKAQKATTQAIKSRDLPYWLLAISSIIWTMIFIARRYFGAFARGKSARAAAIIAGIAAGAAAQMLGGAQPWKAIVVALTGGGAIAQNELLRLFGIDPSQPKTKQVLTIARDDAPTAPAPAVPPPDGET